MFFNVNDQNTHAHDYKSSGIILTKNVNGENHFLFLIEPRSEHPEPVVHIIGGRKEECEYPQDTVAREAWEETTGLISIPSCLNIVLAPSTSKYWYNRGKYILYIGECPSELKSIDTIFNKSNSNKLVWIADSELVNNIQNKKFSYVDNEGKCYKYSNLLETSLVSLTIQI